MTTLILGAGGMLGRALVEEGQDRKEQLVALGHADVDVTHREELLRAALAAAPGAIINCAALTAVDECEDREAEAMAVNGVAVGHVAEAAEAASAHLVQISTDFVFDGEAAGPYVESTPPAPLSAYGRSKLEGERLARQWESSLVLRTSWLFGPGGPNFVATVARSIATVPEPLRVVDDQVGCPTYTPYLARGIWDLVGLRSTGIVHYRNRDPISWHGFAVKIASLLGDPKEVEAITTEELARPAPRPRYSVLDVSRFESLTGRSVEAWTPGLEDYLHLIRDRGP